MEWASKKNLPETKSRKQKQNEDTSKQGGRDAVALCESPWLIDRGTPFDSR
jgi:hypothetical protein